MSFLAQQLLWGAVLPGTITAVLLLMGWRAWRRDGVPVYWGTPVALAIGYLFAHWRIVGLPLSFPPSDSTAWLFVVAAVMAGWGVLEHVTNEQVRARARWRLLLVGVITWLVVRPLMGNVWQGVTGWLWWTGLTLGWWLWWTAQERIAERLPGLPVALVLSMTAGGGGFVLLWSNSSSLSQLSGAVAAVSGVLVPLMLWRHNARVGAGAVATVAGILGLIWVNAIAFVPVPVVRIIALAAASLTPLVALIPAVRKRPAWASAVACAVLTAVVLAVVMFPTYRAYVASASAYGY